MLAYGAGLYGGACLLGMAAQETEHIAEAGFPLVAGGAVALLAAANGAYSVIRGIQPPAPPHQEEEGGGGQADPSVD